MWDVKLVGSKYNAALSNIAPINRLICPDERAEVKAVDCCFESGTAISHFIPQRL